MGDRWRRLGYEIL